MIWVTADTAWVGGLRLLILSECSRFYVYLDSVRHQDSEDVNIQPDKKSTKQLRGWITGLTLALAFHKIKASDPSD